MTAIAAWALSQPGVTAVTANTDLDNGLSQRVLERVGFVRISTTADLCAYELSGI